MKYKKGFTLVEIIVVVALIAFIGTISFFGIRLISKNIKTSKLEQITDRVLQAAEVYIETHKETQNQLYTKKNSVVIPLNTLLNEGLLDLKGTTLEDKDIENEYVVTAFTKDGETEPCINITSNASWNLSKNNPFYICSDKSGGSNNYLTISGPKSNIDTVSVQDEVAESDGIHHFTTAGDNFITYNKKTYRILLVDRDDSLVIATKDKTQQYISCPLNDINKCWDGALKALFIRKNATGEIKEQEDVTIQRYNTIFYLDSSCSDTKKLTKDNEIIYIFQPSGKYYYYAFIFQNDINPIDGEVALTYNDYGKINKTIDLTIVPNSSLDTVDLYTKNYSGCSHNRRQYTYLKKETQGKKIKLKSCMKITGGTGTEVNPYELSDLC